MTIFGTPIKCAQIYLVFFLNKSSAFIIEFTWQNFHIEFFFFFFFPWRMICIAIEYLFILINFKFLVRNFKVCWWTTISTGIPSFQGKSKESRPWIYSYWTKHQRYCWELEGEELFQAPFNSLKVFQGMLLYIYIGHSSSASIVSSLQEPEVITRQHPALAFGSS